MARRRRVSLWLRRRISDFFSSATKTLPRWLFADGEIRRWNASAAGLDLLQRPACKFGLSLAAIRRRPKRASLKEQISARLCCKCCTINVRRAGLPWTLMTLTLRACHAWGNPTLTLCSAGVDCSHWEFSLASLRTRIAFFSEARPGKVYVWETLRKVRTIFFSASVTAIKVAPLRSKEFLGG